MQLTPADRSKIRAALDRFFSEDDLKTLCFELGVDFDNLSSDNKSGKARELIQWCERSERLPDLLAAIVRLRPNTQDDLVFPSKTLSQPSAPISAPPIIFTSPDAPPASVGTKRSTWVWLAGAAVGLIGLAALVRLVFGGLGVAAPPEPLPTLTSLPQPTSIPSPPVPSSTDVQDPQALILDDFEGSEPISSLLSVNTDDVNTGEVSYAALPHVGHSKQAVQFKVDFRNTNTNPSENYITLVRNLTPPGQDWSRYSQFCAWIESSEDTTSISFDVGNKYPQVHDKLVALKPGQNEYCVSLRPTQNDTDLTQINYYQFALSGGPEAKKVTVYIDHVYLKP
jgi:hypothetical protein